MSWREFIASLVNALAWPGAVVVMAALLRRHVASAFDAPLQRLKLGPAGAEFEWDIAERETAVAAATSVLAAQAPSEVVDERLAAIESLIEKAPAVAIRQAFDVVDSELRRLVDDRALELPYPNPDFTGYLRAAYHGDAISRDTGDALRGLLILRDMTANDPGGTRTTPEKAREFLALVRPVLYAMDSRRQRAAIQER